MARRLGWSVDTYRRVEYGLENMTSLRLKRVSEALGCRVRELVDVEGE